MKAVVFQSSSSGRTPSQQALEDLGLIQNKSVTVTGWAEEVIDFVQENPNEELLVISSDYTYDPDMPNADSIAKAAREINPNVYVYTFTTSPTSRYHINGRVVPVIMGGCGEMASFVKEVVENGHDVDRLKELFPKVEFLTPGAEVEPVNLARWIA